MKIKKKRKFTSSFRCNCNDPNCGETKMAALCDWVGHDLLHDAYCERVSFLR